MENKTPQTGIAVVVIRNNQILLGLLTKKWLYNGIQVYGVPGRSIRFGEKIGDAVKRNIREDIGCTVTSYKIFSVNANYAWGNHYIEVGVLAEIEGEIANLVPEDWERWEWVDLGALPTNLFPSAQYAIDCYTGNAVNISE